MSIYACSDFHGHKELYDLICKDLAKEDRVYFLGDAGDRGPHSWELIKAIYQNPQFIYLYGNHEDMLVKAMADWLEEGLYDEHFYLLQSNGGEVTFYDWTQETTEEQYKWYRAIARLPVIEKYLNKHGQEIILSHAGYTPKPGFNPPDRMKLIWDRGHIYDSWNPYLEDTYIVHGHSTPSVRKWIYADDHKFSLDCKTHHTGLVRLLDLNTWESRLYRL